MQAEPKFDCLASREHKTVIKVDKTQRWENRVFIKYLKIVKKSVKR